MDHRRFNAVIFGGQPRNSVEQAIFVGTFDVSEYRAIDQPGRYTNHHYTPLRRRTCTEAIFKSLIPKVNIL
jgi:hypothetical protein